MYNNNKQIYQSPFFIKNWLDNRKIPFESRIKHTKDLNEVYKRLRWIWLEWEFEKPVLKVPKDPYKYEVYDIMKGQTNPFVDPPESMNISQLLKLWLALEHLKKYPQIYRLWNKAYQTGRT